MTKKHINRIILLLVFFFIYFITASCSHCLYFRKGFEESETVEFFKNGYYKKKYKYSMLGINCEFDGKWHEKNDTIYLKVSKIRNYSFDGKKMYKSLFKEKRFNKDSLYFHLKLNIKNCKPSETKIEILDKRHNLVFDSIIDTRNIVKLKKDSSYHVVSLLCKNCKLDDRFTLDDSGVNYYDITINTNKFYNSCLSPTDKYLKKRGKLFLILSDTHKKLRLKRKYIFIKKQ